LLNNIRKKVEPAIRKIGLVATKIGISPTGWTIISLVVAIISGYFYSQGGWKNWAIAGILLLISGFIDIIDGAVARVSKRITSKGAFLDSTIDRLSEIAVYSGIVLSGTVPYIYVFFAIIFSIMVSYIRAKGESLGVKTFGVGIGERAERLIVLAVFSVIGEVTIGVIAVFILALITFIHKFAHIVNYLK